MGVPPQNEGRLGLRKEYADTRALPAGLAESTDRAPQKPESQQPDAER